MHYRILRFTAPIGDFRPKITPAEVEAALAPDEVASDHHLDLEGVFVDGDPSSWLTAIDRLTSTVAELDTSDPAVPVAVLGLAPIPALVGLGRLVGDKRTVRVFERHRHTNSWRWEDATEKATDWQIVRPARTIPGCRDVAVLLSVSGDVDAQQVAAALPSTHPQYELRISKPLPNMVRTEAQLQGFAEKWRELLNEIRSAYGADVRINLFPAVPVSVAVECGRRMLPKVDPPIRVFDARNKRFVYALTVGERGVYREPGALVGDQVDLLVLVALAEEFEQLAALLPKTEAVPDAVHGGCDYLCTLPAKERPVRVALRLVGAMGIGEAQLTADRSIERWKPKAAVWLGIAAGIHNDLRLCDVVVPDQVDAFDANLKAVPDGEDGYTFQERGAVFHGDHALVSAIGQLQFSHREDYEGWRLAGGADLATEVAATLRKEFGPLLGEAPRVKVGHIASGSVVGAAPAFLARLRKRDGTLLALEMETAGLARAAVKRATSTRFLAIRGVSDRGDADKTLLDKVGDGALRRVAMRNAVRLFLLLVRVGSIPHDRQ